MTDKDQVNEMVTKVTKGLTDDGKLIEAGAVIYLNMARERLSGAPPEAFDELLYAFMAGAQHLWGSVMSLLDEGHEPTDDDLRRFDIINKELHIWIERFAQRYRPGGSA